MGDLAGRWPALPDCTEDPSEYSADLLRCVNQGTPRVPAAARQQVDEPPYRRYEDSRLICLVRTVIEPSVDRDALERRVRPDQCLRITLLDCPLDQARSLLPVAAARGCGRGEVTHVG